jgi:hypothetical protein
VQDSIEVATGDAWRALRDVLKPIVEAAGTRRQASTGAPIRSIAPTGPTAQARARNSDGARREPSPSNEKASVFSA